jgi:sugar lactone lactonase YvrE
LVVGPTGLVFDAERDTLYVASTGDNAIFAVPNAAHATQDNGPGSVIYQDPAHLHGPLALAQTPNGDLIASNCDVMNPDPNQLNEIVEFTKDGRFVKQIQVDPGAGGAAFGLAIHTVSDDAVEFAAVDDNTNSLIIWTLPRVP